MNYYSLTTLNGSPSLPPKTVLTVSGNANHPIPKEIPREGFFYLPLLKEMLFFF
jgi:hypothetical protein